MFNSILRSFWRKEEKPLGDLRNQHIEVKPVDSSSSSESNEIEWSVEEETAVRRKLDTHIVPVVTVLYLSCFLDRANIGNAQIQGMATDLNLVGYRFNWALSVFFIFYLLVEIPSNIILKQVGPRFWIPFLVGGFGFVSLCTAFVSNFDELCVARAFLGVFEGGTLPGISFFLSCFYTRRELYFRVGIFVSAASMAGAFGGLLAAGLARIPRWGASSVPIHTWRNIFFFEGLITVFIALIAPIWMPQSPESCNFLTQRQRKIAKERLIREHKGDSKETVNMKHIKMAVFNMNNMISAGGFFCANVTVQGLSVFLPTVLRDLGWTATQAQLYSVPVYVCACVVAIAVAFLSCKTHMRGLYLALGALPPVIGFALLRWNTDVHIRYMAVYFCAIGAFPAGPGFISWAINNSAGPAVRAVTSAYIVSVGTFGGILAVWAYLAQDAPTYYLGHTINMAAQIAIFCFSCFGIFWGVRENRLRIRGKRNDRLNGLTASEAVELGHKHPEFRYIP